MKDFMIELMVMVVLWVVWSTVAMADAGAWHPVRSLDNVATYDQVPVGMCMYVSQYPGKNDRFHVEYPTPLLMCR